jgi:hypothetical protein
MGCVDEAAKAKDKEPMQEVTADTEPTEGAAATQELEMIDKEEEKEWLKFNDILVTEVLLLASRVPGRVFPFFSR